MVGATGEMAIELEFHEQVVCQELPWRIVEFVVWNAKRRAQFGRKSGDRCSLTTNQSHQHSCVVESVSCVDLYTVTFHCRR